MLAHAASRDSVLPPSSWHPPGHPEKMRMRGGGRTGRRRKRTTRTRRSFVREKRRWRRDAEVVDKDFAVRFEHYC